jgi:cell wall-associated NlpC family hydrolase
MSACSTKQVKVEPRAKVEVKTKPKVSIATKANTPSVSFRKPVNLTTLSSTIPKKQIWIPLKLEDEIEWNSKELLGKKYVWGATGPHTYDCSGFTQKIYDDLGINIPRISRHQATVGKHISFANLKKGDMVFFQTNKKRPGKVTHVGIYLGNGDFIHASSSAKKIVICNFNKDCFYKKTFLWGRRVLQLREHLASN